MRNFLFIWILLVSLLLIGSCRSHKKSIKNRHYYAFRTRYNSYYNAQVSFEKALLDTTSTFEETILKCRKTIELYSIRIKQKEQNSFIVHCWLLMGKAYYYNKEYQEANQVFSYIREHFREKEKIVHESYLWEIKSLLASGDTLQALFLSEAVDKKQLSRADRKEFISLTSSISGFVPETSLTDAKYYLSGNYWQWRKTESLQRPLAVPEREGFIVDENCSIVLFVYPEGVQTDEHLLYNILAFNFTYLYIKQLQVEIQKIDNLQAGVVYGFTGIKEINQYLSLLYTYSTLNFKELIYTLPISASNHQVIKNTEELHKYFIFYLSEEICKLPEKHKLHILP